MYQYNTPTFYKGMYVCIIYLAIYFNFKIVATQYYYYDYD